MGLGANDRQWVQARNASEHPRMYTVVSYLEKRSNVYTAEVENLEREEISEFSLRKSCWR